MSRPFARVVNHESARSKSLPKPVNCQCGSSAEVDERARRLTSSEVESIYRVLCMADEHGCWKSPWAHNRDEAIAAWSSMMDGVRVPRGMIDEWLVEKEKLEAVLIEQREKRVTARTLDSMQETIYNLMNEAVKILTEEEVPESLRLELREINRGLMELLDGQKELFND